MVLKIEGEEMSSEEDIYQHFSDLVEEKRRDQFLNFARKSNSAYKTIALAFYYLDSGKNQKEIGKEYDVTTSALRNMVKEICLEYDIRYPVGRRQIVEKETPDGETVAVLEDFKSDAETLEELKELMTEEQLQRFKELYEESLEHKYLEEHEDLHLKAGAIYLASILADGNSFSQKEVRKALDVPRAKLGRAYREMDRFLDISEELEVARGE